MKPCSALFAGWKAVWRRWRYSTCANIPLQPTFPDRISNRLEPVAGFWVDDAETARSCPIP
jgi:hypothetical protein